MAWRPTNGKPLVEPHTSIWWRSVVELIIVPSLLAHLYVASVISVRLVEEQKIVKSAIDPGQLISELIDSYLMHAVGLKSSRYFLELTSGLSSHRGSQVERN